MLSSSAHGLWRDEEERKQEQHRNAPITTTFNQRFQLIATFVCPFYELLLLL